MGHSVISLGLGLGGGKSATSSGVPPAVTPSGFNIATRDTESNILARTGDAVGTIAFGTDTNSLYIYDGLVWVEYDNNFTI